jgi:hypothetical protein
MVYENNLEEFYNNNVNLTYSFPEEFEHKTTPYLPLLIDGPWKEMLKEARAVDDMFVTHRRHSSEGWTSLCIHGYGATKTDADELYPEHAGQKHSWTEVADLCPITAEYFKNEFPYGCYQRLRFMRLRPGGYIIPHIDADDWQLAAVNVSLNHPKDCNLVVEGVGAVPFKDSGGAIAFNTSYNHCVWNRGTETRYHILVHGGEADEYWNNVIPNSLREQSLSRYTSYIDAGRDRGSMIPDPNTGFVNKV